MTDPEFAAQAYRLHACIAEAVSLTQGLYEAQQAETNSRLLTLGDVTHWLRKIHPLTTELTWYSRLKCGDTPSGGVDEAAPR
jgi:hypothetical protein